MPRQGRLISTMSLENSELRSLNRKTNAMVRSKAFFHDSVIINKNSRIVFTSISILRPLKPKDKQKVKSCKQHVTNKLRKVQ